jgi:hypothetical protein
MDIRLARSLFSPTAPLYEWLTTHPLQRRAIAALSARLPAEGGLLEVACGPAVVLDGLLRAPGTRRTGVGLDVARGALARARRRLHPARVVMAHVHDLPFGDGAFDAAVISGALYLMTDGARVLAEMRRVSRGVVAVLEAAPGLDWRAALDPRRPVGVKARLDCLVWGAAMRVSRRFTGPDLEGALAGVGLRDVAVEAAVDDLYWVGHGRVPS